MNMNTAPWIPAEANIAPILDADNGPETDIYDVLVSHEVENKQWFGDGGVMVPDTTGPRHSTASGMAIEDEGTQTPEGEGILFNWNESQLEGLWYQ